MGQFAVRQMVGQSPPALEHPVPAGTRVRLDPTLRVVGREIISGGSPWRLLRVNQATSTLIDSWRQEGVVHEGQGHLARTLVDRGLLSLVLEGAGDLDDVEVVVPFSGDPETLRETLSSLRGLAVTVVDDGGTYPGALADLTSGAGARVTRRDERGGPAAARNSGLRATTRPFVWFVDADVTVPDVNACGRRLRGHFADPRVAAVSARILGLGGSSGRERFEERLGPLDLGPASSLVAANGPIPYVPSACLMVRREALGDGFDESLTHGEDVDLVWRLAEAGWLVRHDSECRVRHRTRAGWRDFLLQRFRYGRSAAALHRRHPDAVAALRVDAWTLASWLALLARRPLRAVVVVLLARRALMSRLPPGQPDAESVANEVVVRGVAGAGGPLARAAVRGYTPAILLATLSRRTRPSALALYVAGTAWRWRRARFRLGDLVPALADDAAYSLGLWAGALHERQLGLLVPKVSLRTSSVIGALRGAPRVPPPVEPRAGSVTAD
jgi:mycofactocin system glycosyltransferase